MVGGREKKQASWRMRGRGGADRLRIMQIIKRDKQYIKPTHPTEKPNSGKPVLVTLKVSCHIILATLERESQGGKKVEGGSLMPREENSSFSIKPAEAMPTRCVAAMPHRSSDDKIWYWWQEPTPQNMQEMMR
ncbi:uncharacterized protein MCYG_06337 [Microsporum canis CBS 113480]|uniref:Uncharacterized protein n=1 Tax=Arthroderma otae (strain ATCC MYA-4605 / CBS 113480) TaxID=554155 RepID=C5FUD4_ARTOC|nr:uncharacterized protein MCYG_06337 [Microsporum canis CBS 113480]EEQ33518.1 predicted protein [Microsporum canis CBS 113480]